MNILNSLKALALGILTDEPVLVQGVVVAVVGTVVALVGLTLSPAVVASIAVYVVGVLGSAFKVRSKVTPS